MSRYSRLSLLFVVVLGACSETAKIPCTDQATCAPYGAICVEGFCLLPPEGETFDLSTLADLTDPPDLVDPGCADNSACTTATTPICDPLTRACRACAVGECAAASLCAPSGACVGCLAQADCDASRKLCDTATNQCVACKAHAECASRICDAGLCAPEASIAHVDNKLAPCTGADGTKTKPFCDVAIAVATGKPYVLIEQTSTVYPALDLVPTSDAPLMIVGLAGFIALATPAFQDPTAMKPSLRIYADEAQDYHVTLDGIWASTASGGANPAAVVCTRASGSNANIHLTIRNSLASGDANRGLDAFGCDLTLESNILGTNHGAVAIGIYGEKIALRRNRLIGGSTYNAALQSTTYVAENNVFESLDITGAGAVVSLDASSTGTFRFNTVAGNTRGISCGAGAAKEIRASIIAGMPEPISGNCTLVDTVTPMGSVVGTPGTPEFEKQVDHDFHLKANKPANQACCTNKLTTGPAVDLDDTPRPKGAMFDIGAYEAE